MGRRGNNFLKINSENQKGRGERKIKVVGLRDVLHFQFFIDSYHSNGTAFRKSRLGYLFLKVVVQSTSRYWSYSHRPGGLLP